MIITLNTSWNLVNLCSELIGAFVANGCELAAIAHDDEYVLKLSVLGCGFVALPLDNKGANTIRELLLFFGIFKLLKRKRPDVLFGCNIKPSLYVSLLQMTSNSQNKHTSRGSLA